jgi:hypothetical protein
VDTCWRNESSEGSGFRRFVGGSRSVQSGRAVPCRDQLDPPEEERRPLVPDRRERAVAPDRFDRDRSEPEDCFLRDGECLFFMSSLSIVNAIAQMSANRKIDPD